MKKSMIKKIALLIFISLAILSATASFLNVDDYDIQTSYVSSKSSNIAEGNSYLNYNSGSNNTSSSNDNVSNNISYEASGFCDYVVDGDTLDVSGVGRIRLVGVNTPERGEKGYIEATDFVKSKCLGKKVYLDIDDKKNKDKYDRILAVVYVDGYNINQELLKQGYAEIMFIPPSEFNPYSWN